MVQTLTYPARGRRGGLAAGIAISVLLHVLVLAMLRAPSAPPAQLDSRRWTEPLTIRILPPPPPPKVEPEPKQVVREPRQKPARPARPAARPTPERTIAEQPNTVEQPTMTVVPAEPTSADNAPTFDPEAARAAARAMANDLNPSTNWVAEKLNKEKALQETKEERLGRNVAKSARGDCRTAYAGAGLLAPLIMLMDKKDSGCKW